jgi:hypothetical protein
MIIIYFKPQQRSSYAYIANIINIEGVGKYRRHQLTGWQENDIFVAPEHVPLFSEQELKEAIGAMRCHKAPGPDGIPTEVLKVVARSSPHLLLNMYNRCLMEGLFPTQWKVQRLVLISKGKGDPETPSAYRPLCMLDTAGKLLERLLKPRLTQAVQAAGGLSNRQYGFRPGRSTICAVNEVVRTFQEAQRPSHRSRKLIILALLDVRNAFNSVRWVDMIRALRTDFRIPPYLLKMVQSYLQDRKLIFKTPMDCKVGVSRQAQHRAPSWDLTFGISHMTRFFGWKCPAIPFLSDMQTTSLLFCK